MENEVKAREKQKITETGCCHHYWVIDTAVGPTSKGVCRLCGAQREFDNTLLDEWVDPWSDGDLSSLSRESKSIDLEDTDSDEESGRA